MTAATQQMTQSPMPNEEVQKLYGEVQRLTGEQIRLQGLVAYGVEQNMLLAQSFRAQADDQQRRFNDAYGQQQIQLQTVQAALKHATDDSVRMSGLWEAGQKRITELVDELALYGDAQVVPLLDSQQKVKAARLLFGDAFVEARIAPRPADAVADTEGGDAA